MLGDRQQQAHYQSEFYRINYHRILNGLMFLCLVMLLLIGTIIYFVIFPKPATYYATTTNGQIIPMTPKS